MSIPIQELAWMAGVLDLKGRIIRKKNKQRNPNRPQLVLMVETKEYPVIRELCRLTGTRVELKQQHPLSEWVRHPCVEHCPEPHTHVTSSVMPNIARWTITGASMAIVIYNVLPFLRNDNGLEEVMTEAFANMITEGQGAAAVVKSLSRLHELGWEFPPQFAIPEERLALGAKEHV